MCYVCGYKWQSLNICRCRSTLFFERWWRWLLPRNWNVKPTSLWQAQVNIFPFMYFFHIILIPKKYEHILRIGICLYIIINTSLMYVNDCFYFCIWVNLVFLSVYSVLVYHGYANAWWVGTWQNILSSTNKHNSKGFFFCKILMCDDIWSLKWRCCILLYRFGDINIL